MWWFTRKSLVTIHDVVQLTTAKRNNQQIPLTLLDSTFVSTWVGSIQIFSGQIDKQVFIRGWQLLLEHEPLLASTIVKKNGNLYFGGTTTIPLEIGTFAGTTPLLDQHPSYDSVWSPFIKNHNRFGQPKPNEPLINIRLTYTADGNTVVGMNTSHAILDGGTAQLVLGLLAHFCQVDESKANRPPPYKLNWERKMVVPKEKFQPTIESLLSKPPNRVRFMTWLDTLRFGFRVLWGLVFWYPCSVIVRKKVVDDCQQKWKVSPTSVAVSLISCALADAENWKKDVLVSQVVNTRARPSASKRELEECYPPTYVGNALSEVSISVKPGTVESFASKFSASFRASLKQQKHYEAIYWANNAERLGIKPSEIRMSGAVFDAVVSPGQIYFDGVNALDISKMKLAGHAMISTFVAFPGVGRMFVCQVLNAQGDIIITTRLPWRLMNRFKSHFTSLCNSLSNCGR